ncbi:DUF262 domain-containing protein [Clostridium aquiflavi]|uniref:DUF262 domain-containing protein n=1 Tax=Clostridium aquiflavi TaxID=3073603 RepID=A0ABU1ED27_9CLOT|nr:DUF262 domain-containing protein [Clostridium sp. 5N-1]MDR5586052.1 DUF262 domain-containing protein [Clostridium sp. 5N-1]
MAGCTCENWTIQDLSCALRDMHKDSKRIVVPMFQRGKRWKKDQEHKFIDSVIKGYPVGTMLFYETFEDNKRTYILVDGLQRGNSIKKYMTSPTEFFYDDSISDELCASILELISKSDESEYVTVRNILSEFIKEQKTFKNLQYYEVAKKIAEKFSAGYEPIGEIIEIIKAFFEERQALYDKIASTVIPVIVYNGDENNLPEIFDRINSQGTPLDPYEVYAASWPVNQRYTIANSEIIECVVRKYDTFIEDDFVIHGYNREEMRSKKAVNAFEYLFGLSKYLVNKYSILAFNTGLSDDTVNSLGFELVNACLNDTDRIKTLYKNLQTIDVNAFEQALYKSIDFVAESISIVTKFKGNSRSANKLFHSKYQILSMISTTFKEMYEHGNYTTISPQWNDRKHMLSKNLMLYYVYDIITNYWSEGGTNKIHSAAKPNRYMIQISSRTWMVALDSFFEKSMLRAETKKVASLKSEEYVILNCIYLNTFTAMDQLSIEKFDVEHIAPKDQVRRLIEACQGEGLPISCIANLCYLPEYINRSKRDRNFYQDKKYLQHINLQEVECKYSFTESEDLEWMDMPYEKMEDFEVLKDYYTDYCTKRFDRLKHLLCDSLSIEYEKIDTQTDVVQEVVLPKQEERNPGKQVKFADKCILKLAQAMGKDLIKVGRSSYKTKDSNKGFIITTSKMYIQGSREKYWFAYRKNPLKDIQGCEEQYVVYGCKDESTIILLPISEIEKRLDCINISKDEDGNIVHWHMVFFKDKNGKMAWLLSKPQLEEIDITDYQLED